MKKLIALLLSLALGLQLAACGAAPASGGSAPASEPASAAADGTVQAEGMLWPVTPLPEKTKLTVSYLANSTAEAVTYLAQQKGWLEACNLEVEMVYFAGGPAQMEASTSWDVGTSGIGGMITGLLNYDIRCLGVVSLDRGLYQAFFARKDSPIVQAGTGHSAVDGVYGTAETWKGAKVLTATGTANQYTLYHTLKSFGLNLSDVEVVNMDVATIPTAFLAGEGDVGGIQGLTIQDPVFQGEESEYVMVSSDQLLQCGLPVNYVATARALEEKQQAVELWLELAMMAGEYANANQEEVAAMMVDMYAMDGYETKEEDNLVMIQDNPFISVADNYAYFTEKSEDGTMLEAEAQIYEAMQGYVEMGNYTADQLDALITGETFLPGPVTQTYEHAQQ